MNTTDRNHAHNLLDTCIANGDGEVATGVLEAVIKDPERSVKLLVLNDALQMDREWREKMGREDEESAGE